MDADIYTAPEAGLDKKSLKAPALWNPDACGLWSLLFTPIFGSFLVMKNWQQIGDEARVRSARVWFAMSIVIFIVSLFVNLIAFLWLVVWYFASQKRQTKYVLATYGENYPRRPWGKVMLIALGLLLVAWGLLVGVVLFVSSFA